MRNTPAIDKEQLPSEAPCPRCSIGAEWSFTNRNQTRVEVVCPDCGRFELSREEFDQAEGEIAAPDEQA